MTVLKPCVVCGTPTGLSRCPEHRPAKTKPSPRTRGYTTSWDKLSKRARKLQPFCSDCGSTEDLQTDHTPEAWARKAKGLAIRLQDVDVVCRPCNNRRGAARGNTVTRGDTPSRGSQDCRGSRNPRYTSGGGVNHQGRS